MERMTVNDLRGKYADVFGEGTNGRNKQWLIKRIAWRMQANVEGDLSKSLSAVARAVTGSHWSGHRFFGLPQGTAK
jgi:hypothetical protein